MLKTANPTKSLPKLTFGSYDKIAGNNLQLLITNYRMEARVLKGCHTLKFPESTHSFFNNDHQSLVRPLSTYSYGSQP